MKRSPAAPPWTADVAIDDAIASACIAEQFPQLAGRPVRPLGQGWDNAAFEAGEYVFRFPRRAVAVALIETELRILPSIAAHLPLPISAPCFSGKPAAQFPWPFAGYRRLPGEPLAQIESAVDGERAIAAQLGAFLRALHALDAGPALDAGLAGDTIGRLDPVTTMERAAARFAELEALGLLDDADRQVAELRALAPALPGEARCIVHGDLYAAHVLVERGACSGIIDWGDLHFGDPAIDLAVAFEVLPPTARDQFFGSYGQIGEAAERRARYRALYHAALVAQYGAAIGDRFLRDAGLRGIAYAAR
ncbi:MAG TPA: phosphotransferase [Verrucomicrobiae bacterium]|nr:phosphotransferase [Verrucomicrobiae bacterium]